MCEILFNIRSIDSKRSKLKAQINKIAHSIVSRDIFLPKLNYDRKQNCELLNIKHLLYNHTNKINF